MCTWRPQAHQKCQIFFWGGGEKTNFSVWSQSITCQLLCIKTQVTARHRAPPLEWTLCSAAISCGNCSLSTFPIRGEVSHWRSHKTHWGFPLPSLNHVACRSHGADSKRSRATVLRASVSYCTRSYFCSAITRLCNFEFSIRTRMMFSCIQHVRWTKKCMIDDHPLRLADWRQWIGENWSWLHIETLGILLPRWSRERLSCETDPKSGNLPQLERIAGVIRRKMGESRLYWASIKWNDLLLMIDNFECWFSNKRMKYAGMLRCQLAIIEMQSSVKGQSRRSERWIALMEFRHRMNVSFSRGWNDWDTFPVLHKCWIAFLSCTHLDQGPEPKARVISDKLVCETLFVNSWWGLWHASCVQVKKSLNSFIPRFMFCQTNKEHATKLVKHTQSRQTTGVTERENLCKAVWSQVIAQGRTDSNRVHKTNGGGNQNKVASWKRTSPQLPRERAILC